MSIPTDIQPIETNENSTSGEVQEAIRVNSAAEVQAKTAEVVIAEEESRLQAEDTGVGAVATELGEEVSEDSEPVAKGSTEGAVYGDVALEAVGGSILKAAKTVADVVQDSDPGKFAGKNTMEDVIRGAGKDQAVASAAKPRPKATGEDIMGDKVNAKDMAGLRGENSIITGHFNDLFGRSEIAKKSLNGDAEDRPKGIQSTQESVVATLKTQHVQHLTAQMVSAKHLGIAKGHEQRIGGENLQMAQAGMAPGGNSGVRAASLDLSQVKPKGPTHMTDEETGTVAT